MYVDLSTSLALFGQQPIGILRTERELARRLLLEPRIVAVPFVFSAGCLFALEQADALRLVGQPSAPERSTAEPPDVGYRLVTRVAVPDPSPTAPHKTRRMPVRAMLRQIARRTVAAMPHSIREDVRLVLIHGREIVRKTSRPISRGMLHGPPAGAKDHAIEKAREAIWGRVVQIGWPEAGEVLWTCGLYGTVVPLRLVAEAKERHGFSCAVICYDLIGNDNPEWNPEKPRGPFHDCVAVDLLDVADRVLCLSAYTMSRLCCFASRYGRNGSNANVITPGSDLWATGRTAALPAELTGRRFVLSVGTVAQRKNFGTLIRVWDALADDPGFRLDLVLVGPAAEWDAPAVREIETAALLGQRIFWFRDCSDDILGLLYRQADALLYPSFMEGGGLPVSEALAFGTPVLASNAGAIPEIAAGRATLLDPHDEAAWRNAIRGLAMSPPPKLTPVQPPTWDSAAASVVSHIDELARARVARVVV